MIERPPVAGQVYVAFVAHPSRPGPLALAIAHHDGKHSVLDLVWEGGAVAHTAPILKRYGISEVIGLVDDGDTRLATAVAGAITSLRPLS